MALGPTLPGPVAITLTIATCMLSGFWFGDHRGHAEEGDEHPLDDARHVKHEMGQGTGLFVDGVEHGVRGSEEGLLKVPAASGGGARKVSHVAHKAEAKEVDGVTRIATKFSQGAHSIVTGVHALQEDLKDHMNRAI